MRYKGFTIINIGSLTIGVTACLIIGLFVWDEWRYDKNIPGGENIYRIYNERKDNNNITYAAVVAPAYATFLQQQYPEIDTTARIMMIRDKFLMEVGDKKAYEEKGWLVDASFLKLFSLQLSNGDPATALTEPSAIVISAELAKKYFGKENPVGKEIKVDKGNHIVKGVLAKLPDHFHLDFNYLMPVISAGIPKERMEVLRNDAA